MPSAPQRLDAKTLDHPDSLWNRAAAVSAPVDPFCCRTEWQLSYQEAFGPERELLVYGQGDSLVAMADWQIQEAVAGPLDSSWQFGSPLLGPNALELLEELLADGTFATFTSGVVLAAIAPTGQLAVRMLSTIGQRLPMYRIQTETMVSASLAGGLDGYLGRRSSKWRRGLRQASRRGKELGVTFERHTPRDEATAAAVYARMLAVEATSWKGIGACGMTVEGSREFYAAMMRRLSASGRGRVIFAQHDGADIGFIFGGLTDTVYRGQQFSYAEDWHAHSIGNLLQLEQLGWLAEEGAERYDMGPLMEYKLHWTEIQTRIESWLVAPRRRA